MQPSCVVIMGGHHVTSQDDIVLANHSDCVDVIVRGEGEVATTALLREYPAGGKASESPAEIDRKS